MKTIAFCLLGLLILLLSGCHTRTDDFISKYCPGSCTVIKGRLTTDARNKPLAGVLLEVQYQESDMFSSLVRRKATTTTDADGNFELRFLLRDDELPGEYSVGLGSILVKAHINTASYLSCLGDGTLLDTYELVRDTTISLNYNLPRKAYVQAQILNTESMQPGDNIETSLHFDAGVAGENPGCLTGFIWHRYFNNYLIEVGANQQVILRTRKLKTGTETITEQIVTLQPGKTFRYQVSF